MSRKRVVTNADGSIEETEEVLEPSKISSITGSPSKPVVVGVVPSNISPKYDSSKYPTVRFFLLGCVISISL